MSSATLIPPERTPPPADDPFYIGTRIVNHRDAAGNIVKTEYVPLSEEDFLHPQEEDRFMVNQLHVETIYHLMAGIRAGCRDQKNLRMYVECRVDWQEADVEPHGPDVSVFEHIERELPPDVGTLLVGDHGAKKLAVFEVTSESTRHIDFGPKFDEYLQVGVPYYILVDCANPAGPPRIVGYRLVKKGYREMREDARLGVLIPELKLWFRWDQGRIIMADIDGKDIPDIDTMADLLEAEKQRAEAEKQRAETEKQRAETEKQRAETEKQRAETEKQRAEAANARADAMAAELAALKASLSGTQPKE